jgi:hypothetical protein
MRSSLRHSHQLSSFVLLAAIAFACYGSLLNEAHKTLGARVELYDEAGIYSRPIFVEETDEIVVVTVYTYYS